MIIRKSAPILAISVLLTVASVVPATASEDVTITGGGWGHGIGMPQYGAKALADDGSTATEIIQYFYEGATIGQVGEGNLVGHADPLRIGVFQSVSSVSFYSVNGPVSLCLNGGCMTANAGELWSFKTAGTGLCRFFKAGVAQGTAQSCNGEVTWSNQPDTRLYVTSNQYTYARGKIVFTPGSGSNFHMLVEIGLEPYLYGLGEMPSSWHVEALRAQAIAGRSYALYKAWVWRNLATTPTRLAECGCHMYATTKDQKYIGWAKEAEGTDGFWGDRWVAAVNATAGDAAIHTYSGGRAIQAYYHSSTGGATENNDDVWGGVPFPYLRSKPDPGPTSWEFVISKDDMADELGLDKVLNATITSRYESGSPANIVVAGVDGGSLVNQNYTGGQLDSALGLLSHHIHGFDGFLPTSFSTFLPGNFSSDSSEEVAAFSANDGSWWAFGLSGGQLVGTEWADFTTSGGWGPHLVGDFNEDGLDDIANYHSSNGTWWVSKSTGSGLSTSLWADFVTASGWKTHVAGDFDGDGDSDIASFHPSNGTWWVSRSTGTALTTTLWADFATAGGWTTHVVGDFDNDGKDDIANYHPTSGTWWVSRSTGSGFVTTKWATFATRSGWSHQLVGDFTGDGRDDIANFYPANGTWWVSRSTGSGFITNLWTSLSPGTGWKSFTVGDFGGSGNDDLAFYWPGNGSWWTGISNGSAFAKSYRGSVSPGSGWTGQLAVDSDGDGDDELTNWWQPTQFWALR